MKNLKDIDKTLLIGVNGKRSDQGGWPEDSREKTMYYMMMDPCRLAEHKAKMQADKIKFILMLIFFAVCLGLLFSSCVAADVYPSAP